MAVISDKDILQDAYIEAKRAREKAEHERVRVQHDLHKETLGDSFITVPLLKEIPIKILDSGTGDGYWMKQEALNYPNATFVGTDIDESYFHELPDLSKSISYKVQSVLDPWPDEHKGTYDLVHQRYVMTNMPPARAVEVVKGLLELVKPGGYIQLVEIDMLGFDREGHPGMSEMMDFMARFFAAGGMDPRTGPQLEGWLKAAGAEDVVSRQLSFGMGARGKSKEQQEKSIWNQLTLVNNFAFVCERIPGFWYSPAQFRELERKVKDELESVGNTWRFHIATGRRKV